MRIVYVASCVPRKCGIATFTADLMAAVKAADPSIRSSYAAIDEPNAARAYGADVKWRIEQGEPATYRAAAAAINASNTDIVNVQHEFGLYGIHLDGGYEDHAAGFLEELRKPVVTTLHTILPRPAPWMRDSVRAISALSTAVVVMVDTAARLLRTVYGVEKRPLVIPHGMPAVEPRGRRRLKRELRMEGRSLLLTFGLVDPRKGLEHVIHAMPRIVEEHPDALYLVVGQTHPELLRRHGEAYRNSLVEIVGGLGMSQHVRFVNEYLTQRQVVDYLLASDVYVTPYLDPNQITSGTLAYALGAGKAIVSTPYLHAAEALADGRGILVDFADPAGIGAAVSSILADPQLKQRLETRSYAYGKEMAWPAVGRRVLGLMRDVVDGQRAAALAARDRERTDRALDDAPGTEEPEPVTPA
ncbi:MAG: glycosyltransferase family 4 protein [Candidatus Limnocylindria bacterium]